MEVFSHIQHAVLSDVGRKRKNNEDSFGVFPAAGVFCVADGMGGGDDGEVASAATVRAVETFVTRHPLPSAATYPIIDYVDGLCAAVNSASSWIYRRTQEKNLKGCGSTFVGVCFDAAQPNVAIALHAGDSRLYRIRGRNIQQITKDHSAAELIGAKDERDVNPMFRGMILRAVGIQPRVEVERTEFPIKPGDRILICSDGLSRMVPDKRILAISRANSSVWDAVAAFIAAANEAGGIDNVTAVLVEVGSLPPPLPVIEMPRDKRDADQGEAVTQSGDETDETGVGSKDSFDADSAESFVGTSSPETSSGGDTVTFTSSTVMESALGSTASSVLSKASDAQNSGESMGLDEERGEGIPKIILVLGLILGIVAILGIGLIFFIVREKGPEVPPPAPKVVVITPTEDSKSAEKVETANAGVAATKKSIEEEARRAEEEKKRLAEEEKRKVEEKRRAEEEKKRLAEEMRRVEEGKKRLAEEKRRAEEEKKRLAEEEKRKAEEKRRAEEEKKRLAEEEKRKAEEEKRKVRREKQFKVIAGLKAACTAELSDKFCMKLRDLGIAYDFESLSRQLKIMGDVSKTDEEKFGCAEELTKALQTVTTSLGDYARYLEEEDEDEEEAGQRRKDTDVKANIKQFKAVADRLLSGDSSDPDVQQGCAELIYMVPNWF